MRQNRAQANYAARLTAVNAALTEAELRGRFGEAEALRLAQQVLISLLADVHPQPARTSTPGMAAAP